MHVDTGHVVDQRRADRRQGRESVRIGNVVDLRGTKIEGRAFHFAAVGGRQAELIDQIT